MDRQRELTVDMKPEKFIIDILKCHEEPSNLGDKFTLWLQRKQEEDEACRMILEDRQKHHITGKRSNHKHEIENAIRQYMKVLKSPMGERQRAERVKVQIRNYKWLSKLQESKSISEDQPLILKDKKRAIIPLDAF